MGYAVIVMQKRQLNMLYYIVQSMKMKDKCWL